MTPAQWNDAEALEHFWYEYPQSPPEMVGADRSSRWPLVRAAWLESHSQCAFCGNTTNLNVHHIKPFHLFPELELEPKNFVTLCEVGSIARVNCHLFFGHLGRWDAWNPGVSDLIEVSRGWLAKRKLTKQGT